MNESDKKRRSRLIGGSVACALGIYVLIAVWYLPNRKGRAALAWPEAACEVLASETDRDDGTTTFHVEYTYTVDGVEHVSDRLSTSAAINVSRDEASALLERYAPGTRHTCRVNPADPSDAVLEPGAPAGALHLFAGLFPIAVGGLFLVLGLRRP